MAVDNTGSMFESYPQIVQSVPEFLNQLDSMGWDYHFATMPLTQSRLLSQVVGSVYDSNRGKSWKPPFPGVSSNGAGTLNPNVFRLPSDYSDFIGISDISNATNGMEPGFQTIQDELSYFLGESNFIRSDSLLVMLVVGNGDDTSGISYCARQDGVRVPCEATESSFNNFLNFFTQFKKNIRFYAAVAPIASSHCKGGMYPRI